MGQEVPRWTSFRFPLWGLLCCPQLSKESQVQIPELGMWSYTVWGPMWKHKRIWRNWWRGPGRVLVFLWSAGQPGMGSSHDSCPGPEQHVLLLALESQGEKVLVSSQAHSRSPSWTSEKLHRSRQLREAGEADPWLPHLYCGTGCHEVETICCL